MANPPLLLLDSDALIQIFLADQLRLLQDLKAGFGVRPAVVLEVDTELRWLGRLKDRFCAPLEKALKRGVISKLDEALFQTLLGDAAPGTSWSSFQSLGKHYYGFVQRGEAYSHAAGVSLGVPVASNDFRAIEVLKDNMLHLPSPVLRSFDLFVFAYRSGINSMRESETILSTLKEQGEWVPRNFKRSSFEDGLSKFHCRILDASQGHAPTQANSYSDPVVITRL